MKRKRKKEKLLQCYNCIDDHKEYDCEYERTKDIIIDMIEDRDAR